MLLTGMLCVQRTMCIGAQVAGSACSKRPASKRLLVCDQLTSCTQQGVSFVDLSIVKAHVGTVQSCVVSAAQCNCTGSGRTALNDGSRELDWVSGRDWGPCQHVEGAEGKEAKLEKSEVWTGGDGLREGVPVAQPVASERSHAGMSLEWAPGTP
eukprot:jgi/Bigna1/69968/fgenesh1_pg.10_\